MPFSHYLQEGIEEGFDSFGLNRFGGLPRGGPDTTCEARGHFFWQFTVSDLVRLLLFWNNYSRSWLHFLSKSKLMRFFSKALAQLAVWLFSRVYVSETSIKNRTSALASCESSYAISKLPHSHIACHTVDTENAFVDIKVYV